MLVTSKDRMVVIVKVWDILEHLHHSSLVVLVKSENFRLPFLMKLPDLPYLYLR